MDLLQIESRLKENSKTRKQASEDYNKLISKLNTEEKELKRLKSLNMQGFDMEKISEAEKVLRFNRGFERFNHSVVESAIEDIATKKDELRTKYFGIKDYEHFIGQRCDPHYSYGPRHGYIVFSIGLAEAVRVRELTNKERNACLYYLNLLIDNEEFRKKAK